jgi:hypothetical protein
MSIFTQYSKEVYEIAGWWELRGSKKGRAK